MPSLREPPDQDALNVFSNTMTGWVSSTKLVLLHQGRSSKEAWRGARERSRRFQPSMPIEQLSKRPPWQSRFSPVSRRKTSWSLGEATGLNLRARAISFRSEDRGSNMVDGMS